MVTAVNVKTTKVFDSILTAFNNGKRGIFLEGGTYSTKCLGKGTRIVMSDLTLKSVEDIVIGDTLMGLDGKPRKVLKLYRGQDNLYKIKQAKGIDYVVNSNHILSLRENWNEIRRSVKIDPTLGKGRQKREYVRNDHSFEVFNISLQDYLSKSGKWKRRHKGWKLTGVELPYRDILIEPYFLGLFLGDGTRGTTNITNSDIEIIDYLKWFAVRNELIYHRIKCDKYGHALVRTGNTGRNPLRTALRGYGILDNKRIPHDYLNNSRAVRLELLAGLIDSDGHKSKNCTYIITQKRKELTEDIALLARSLGFPAKINDKIARMKRTDGSIYECLVHQVEFTGDNIADIPVKLSRKRLTNQPLPRRYSSSIEIEPIDRGDYFGFELDGDHLFLLEDFTVTHNTWSALQSLIVVAQKSPRPIDINVVSETIPHLKGGCIRDFFMIMDERSDVNSYYNKTDRIYRRPQWNGVFTFLSADNEKALGMRRDILFINEGDTLYWDTARELISRTNVFTIIDWNPRSEFWAHEYYKEDDVVENGIVVKEGKWDPNWAYDHSTYLDALDVIPSDKAEEIRDLGRKDPNYQNIYELGILGKIEGLVFPFFEQVDELPVGAAFYGLDYGFSADPSVLVKNVVVGENLYSQQMFYEYGLTNDDIAREMRELRIPGDVLIQADPTEPKSAEELRRLGFNVQAIDKAYANTPFGIKQVNAYHQYWTKDSLECIKEQRNCRYIKKREPGTGRVYLSDDITHQFSHGMKGRMYAVATYRGDTPGYRTTIPQRRLVRKR